MHDTIRGIVTTLAVMAFGSIAVPCHAQAAAIPAQEQVAQITLDPVFVAGHYDTAIGSSDAASQGSVSASLLRDLPTLRPGEILEAVPGLVVTQHSGDGKANQYFLRGYNLDHGTDFATYVDNVPLNQPTNAHGQGYADANGLIPEIVDRIDYVKGPYFAALGDFAAAGSASVVYRRALDHSVAQATVGDFGYRRVLLAGSTPVNAADQWTGGAPVALGALEVQQEDGPWTTPEGARKRNLMTRLSQGTERNGWAIDLSSYDARWNATDQVPLSLIDAGVLSRYGAVDPSDGGNSSRHVVAAQWQGLASNVYWRANAFAQRSTLELFSNFTYFEFRPDTGDQFRQAEQRTVFGGGLVAGWRHAGAAVDSATEAGLQLRRDAIGVSLADTQARTVRSMVRDDQVEETAAAIYVQNATSWTPWLKSVVGLREDSVAMRVQANLSPVNSGSASAGMAQPKLALVFGPWYRTEFFVDAGRGFHSNDARGVSQRIDPTTQQPSTPVPALTPARGAEAGMRSEALPGVQTSLALWMLDSDSELIYNADASIGSTSPNAASRRHGIEWNNHATLGRHLLLDADLAWTQARYAQANANGEAGNAIPNAVGRVCLVRATLTDIGPWNAGMELRYIGPYALTQDSTLTAPAALVTNLRLQWQPASGLGASLDVLNAFNRVYDDIAYAQDYRISPSSPVVPAGVTVHPGEPRQFRMTIRYVF